MSKKFNKSRGIALVVAILIVAIVMTTSAFVTFNQEIWIKQTQHFFDKNQIDLLRSAIIDFAKIVLSEDEDFAVDHLQEAWASNWAQFPTPIEVGNQGATFSGNIEDAQAKINLNNLYVNGTFDENTFFILERLFNYIEIDATYDLLESLKDWFEKVPSSNKSNARLVSIDELHFIPGFDNKRIKLILPYVTILPYKNTINRITKINVNTASVPVLYSIFNSDNLAEDIHDKIEDGEYFVNIKNVQKYLNEDWDDKYKNYIDVKSNYFLAEFVIQVGDLYKNYQALLNRKSKSKNSTSTELIWHKQLITN